MVIEKLATTLGIRGDEPNQELAREISGENNKRAVKELIDLLTSKNKSLQSDAIKTLYETGYLNPGLISGYWREFGTLLASKNNRLVWGAMIALDTIAGVNPEGVMEILPEIVKTVDAGSVITKDAGVSILAKLCGIKNGYSDVAFPLLMEQLKKCPAKQLPMYAEKSLEAVKHGDSGALSELLESRFSELEKDSQRKRVEKVLKKMKKG